MDRACRAHRARLRKVAGRARPSRRAEVQTACGGVCGFARGEAISKRSVAFLQLATRNSKKSARGSVAFLARVTVSLNALCASVKSMRED